MKEKEDQLKERSFRKYEDVIDYFMSYLDGYAYVYLEEEDADLFEEKYNNDNMSFCELFDINEISEIEVEEFLSDFLIRKVMSSKQLMKDAGTVMRQLILWIRDNQLLDNVDYKYFLQVVNDLKDDLPKVVELADLISEETRNNRLNQHEYQEFLEKVFIISDIEEGSLWLVDYDDEDNEYGPVIVPSKISDLARLGWFGYLVLGKVETEWHILENGFIYPQEVI